MNRVYLERRIDDKHTRYYKIEYFATLFGDILLERIYGNVSYKKPTGHIKKYYSNMKDANDVFTLVLREKIKRGYIQPKGL